MATGLSQLADAAAEAAKIGGTIITRSLGTARTGKIDAKKAFDFVTEVDLASEKAVLGFIRDNYPDHAVYGEESDKEEAHGDYRWIVDPLDGTTNFIHGYPLFAVSVAVESQGEIVAGAIFDPVRDELFKAAKGLGVVLDGSPIRVSDTSEPSQCLLTTGFPFREKELLDRYLEVFSKLFRVVSGIRRAGSAALDLAYLACGRCDGFWELGLAPWDLAAGTLIVREAGGRITDFSGGDNHIWTGNTIASNGHIHGLLLNAISETFDETVSE